MSVFRELGVISQDEDQKKVPQIEGLELEKLAESFNKSSYATNGIEVETLVRPDKYKNLKIYNKKGFDSSLKLALKDIESKYGEVEVRKVSEPNLISLGETTAKIRLKFKDDSISDEINVKVKVKELPLYHFAPYSARMKKSYGENDEIDLDKLIANLYVPGVSDNGEYLDDDTKYEELKYVEYENFKYFNLKIVKKGTTTEVPNKTKIKDIMTADKKIQLEAYCEKIYTTEFSNRQFIKGLSVK